MTQLQPMQQITSWLLAMPLGAAHLSASAAVVALHLAQALERGGRCRLTVSQLACRVGLSERHVQRALAQILAHPQGPIVREQEHCLATPVYALRGDARVGGGDTGVTQLTDSLSSSAGSVRESSLDVAAVAPPAIPGAPKEPGREVAVDLSVIVQAYERRLGGRTPTRGEIERAKGPLAMLLAADQQLTVDDVAAGILETTNEQMRGSDGRLWDDLPSLLRFPDRFRVQRECRQAAQDEFAQQAAYMTAQAQVIAEFGTAEQREELAQASTAEERCGLLARWQKERARAAWEAYRAGAARSEQPADGAAPTVQQMDAEERRRRNAAGAALCRAAWRMAC